MRHLEVVVRLINVVKTWLFGPQWRVMLNEPGCDVVYHIVRARSGFDAKWKVAERLDRAGDASVGYLAFKWMNNLQLDEGESVDVTRV